MKIAGMILAVLMLLGSVGIGLLATSEGFEYASEMSAGGEEVAEMLTAAGLPSGGRMQLAGALSGVAALAAFGLLLITFIRKEKIPMLIAAAVGFAVVAVIISPSIEMGASEGLDPRTRAIVAAVLAILGAAGSFLVKKGAQAQAPSGQQAAIA